MVLAYYVIINILLLFSRYWRVNYFENNPYHPYDNYSCSKFFKTKKYFSDKGMVVVSINNLSIIFLSLLMFNKAIYA